MTSHSEIGREAGPHERRRPEDTPIPYAEHLRDDEKGTPETAVEHFYMARLAAARFQMAKAYCACDCGEALGKLYDLACGCSKAWPEVEYPQVTT